MTKLREAAQAAVTDAMPDIRLPAGMMTISAGVVEALRAQLSAPPEPGWEEGYRAGVEAAALRTELPIMPGGSTVRQGHVAAAMIRALPVPSAPTRAAPQPERAKLYDAEAWGGAMDALGKMRERAEKAEETLRALSDLSAPAPEAKTAESGAPRCAACGHAEDRHNSAIANGCCEGEWERCGCFRFRAPVEPEETQR